MHLTCFFSQLYLRSPTEGQHVSMMQPRRTTLRPPDYKGNTENTFHLQITTEVCFLSK